MDQQQLLTGITKLIKDYKSFGSHTQCSAEIVVEDLLDLVKPHFEKLQVEALADILRTKGISDVLFDLALNELASRIK